LFCGNFREEGRFLLMAVLGTIAENPCFDYIVPKGGLMKKVSISGLLLCAGVLALYAQSLPSVRIVNNIGHPICLIYASPSESEEWGDEFLGGEVLEDGDNVLIKLSQPLTITTTYDFGVEDEDGRIYQKLGVTVANNARIIFTDDDLYAEYYE
jgi:hypothetical protein